MRIGKVIGNVTLSREHPSIRAGRWKLLVPISLEELTAAGPESRPGAGAVEEVVAYDCMNAGIGEWVALSEGAEAAKPFYPDDKPVDAFIAAIIDTLELESS